MTEQQIEKRIAFLFEAYEAKKKRLNQHYDRRWENAMTAREILAVNEWHDKELEKLAAWWRKSIRELSEASKEGAQA